ncbi:uncharacterized protein KY384_000473 [Bacidia gigantensis]|uniref:uncharacterized protein n=1 Tax=Bacidia gigantensis TaxID=2732470 RepID=UPI001D0523D0|nr:uncharacterized protein KY384_000473 [Bacidia gigantensis]KAG8525713.1 hypothetical protein KY384_000473 [Bacidia gigantensis]
MRLIKDRGHGDLILVEFQEGEIPSYAILSHTWAANNQEVTYQDFLEGKYKQKASWEKLDFCRKQAATDNLEYFWIDTCCINKDSSSELTEAINSMFRWYQNSVKCYVYFSDVSTRKRKHGATRNPSNAAWKTAIGESKWFRRGWTLQELIAPVSVQFFSREGNWLGCKSSLAEKLEEITGIAIEALRGRSVTNFTVEERFGWMKNRETKLQEDQAYCLLGIFNVSMAVIYGERKEKAIKRLRHEIDQSEETQKSYYGLTDRQSQSGQGGHRKLLLESLWFEDIHSREERIVDAHRRTFEWIFEQAGSVAPWSNFVEWLGSHARVYWINGKAGSGKSTLMRFLCNDTRTREFLKVWSAEKLLLTPKFYFWIGGTQLERSIEGLLRSLIWQILQEVPSIQSPFVKQAPIAAWTERRLKEMLENLILQVQASHSLCFFIDGLDEYTGDQDALIDLIDTFARGTKAKFCLSSRPNRVFKETFGLHANLQLQDLTQKDILHYVLDRLQNQLTRSRQLTEEILLNHMRNEVSCWSATSLSSLEEIAYDILVRAQGVFLWVVLAVKDQLCGLKNGDSQRQLRARLADLPNEVEKIYQRMLNQIELPYRKEASMFLQIALAGGRGSSLLAHALALHEYVHDMLGFFEQIPEHDLIEFSFRARGRIALTCEGLLEITDKREATKNKNNTFFSQEGSDGSMNASDAGTEDEYSDEQISTSRPKSMNEDSNRRSQGTSRPIEEQDREPKTHVSVEGTKMALENFDSLVHVDFIHRTAVDYIRDHEKGKAFIRANNPPRFHRHVHRAKVSLARLRLFGPESDDIEGVMFDIWLAEHETAVAQPGLLNMLDNIMWKLDHRYYGHKETHWSSRWKRLCMKHKPNLEVNCSQESFTRYSRNDLGNDETIKQLIIQEGQWTDDNEAEVMLRMDWSLLSFATSCGLTHYVLHILERRIAPIKSSKANCLLSTTVLSIILDDPQRTSGSLHLAMELIRTYGADVNSVIAVGVTIWSLFLTSAHIIHLYTSLHHFDIFFPENSIVTLLDTLMVAMSLMIERGADLGHRTRVGFYFKLHHMQLQPKSLCCHYEMHLTVRSMVRLCFMEFSDTSRIEQMCHPYGSDSLQIQLYEGTYPQASGVKIETHVLSQEESDTLLKTYHSLLVAFNSDGKSKALSPSNERQIVSHFINKVWRRYMEDGEPLGLSALQILVDGITAYGAPVLSERDS